MISKDVNQDLLPTDRKFGAFFSVLSGAFSVYSVWHSTPELAWVAGVLAFTLAALTVFSPQTLHPLNVGWFLFGRLLGAIVNPIVLGLLFFGVITPIALLARLSGRDPLRLRKRPLLSYWLSRTNPDFSPDTFKNQF